MLSVPGLKTADETIGPLQNLTAPFVAPGWASRSSPLLGAYRSAVYAAAVGRLNGEPRLRVALALVWSDAEVGLYHPNRLPYYQEAFLGTPNDERAAFYLTALCIGGLVTDESVRSRAFAAVLRPEWRKSALWQRWGLSATDLNLDLARQYAEGIAGGDCAPYMLSPARVSIVEAAWAMAAGTAERDPFAGFLARAYRSQERRDDIAESIYRHVFSIASEDAENTEYLARLYASEAREDFAAYLVYAHAASHAETAGNFREERKWTIRAARAGARLGRYDRATQTALERAVVWEPDDLTLLMAHGQVVARSVCDTVARTGGVPSDEAEKAASILPSIYRREAELLPICGTRGGGDFETVVRGLAVVWAAQECVEDEAYRVYFRAAATLTLEDREIWSLLAHACAVAGDDSPDSLQIYEQAVGNREAAQLEKPLLMALARAYVRAEAWQGTRCRFALTVWEAVHGQKQADSAMIAAMTRAYEAEQVSNESSLSVWKQTAEAEPKNGELRLRLAQELRSRGEHDEATQFYKEAARLLPRSFTAQYETGIHLREHDSRLAATALRYLQKAVKLPEGRKHRDAHFALGELLLAGGKRAEAEAIFQTLIDEIDAQHAPTLLHLAKLNLKYEEEGSRRAEALFEKARQADPDHPETYRKMADMYRERGQTQEEEQALEQYLSLSDPDAERFRHLADLYLRRGDHVRAEGALRQVIALGEADKHLYTLLGEVIVQARAAVSTAATAA